jgi:hypothetical protein
MKNVLIISDNPILTAIFQRLVSQKKLTLTAIFDYRYSSINKDPKSMIALGCSSINLKHTNDLQLVLDNYHLVISIHCKQIFPSSLTSNIRCINVHPGLNPHNRGWYPQVFSIINKLPIGATIHLMNENIDAGEIIFQENVSIESFDTSLSLYKKIQDAEISLLSKHIESIIFGEQTTGNLPKIGNYNSMDDFRSLCSLDLQSKGTLQDHIDLLRSLSHGDFKNAYFVDASGNKIFVKIELNLENGP